MVALNKPDETNAVVSFGDRSQFVFVLRQIYTLFITKIWCKFVLKDTNLYNQKDWINVLIFDRSNKAN